MDSLEKLKAKYPQLYRKLSYLECDDGWFDLLNRLSHIITSSLLWDPEATQMSDEERSEIYVVQVKEKFGSARYYMNQSTSYINGAIAMAESMSHVICEVCGQPGISRSGGWIKTLCEKHHQERETLKAQKK